MFLSSWTSIFFGYPFNKARHTSQCESIQWRSFFLFSQGSLRGIILGFGFLPYPKLYVFTLRRINGNYLASVVWKITTCWLFCLSFLRKNHGRCRPLSADAYTANKEGDSLMTMSTSANMGGLKREGLSTDTILGYNYSQLTTSVFHLLSP